MRVIAKIWDPEELAIRERDAAGNIEFVGSNYYQTSRFWLKARRWCWLPIVIGSIYVATGIFSLFMHMPPKQRAEANYFLQIVLPPSFLLIAAGFLVLVSTTNGARRKQFLKFDAYGRVFMGTGGKSQEMTVRAQDITSFEVVPQRTVAGTSFKIANVSVFKAMVYLRDGRGFQLFDDACENNARMVARILNNAWQATLGNDTLMPMLGETPERRTATY